MSKGKNDQISISTWNVLKSKILTNLLFQSQGQSGDFKVPLWINVKFGKSKQQGWKKLIPRRNNIFNFRKIM